MKKSKIRMSINNEDNRKNELEKDITFQVMAASGNFGISYEYN